jgi:hypothetical protein
MQDPSNCKEAAHEQLIGGVLPHDELGQLYHNVLNILKLFLLQQNYILLESGRNIKSFAYDVETPCHEFSAISRLILMYLL